MHDVDLAARLQPANECVADRVITADRDEQRIARGDPPGGLGDPLEVAIDLRALDRDVADVGHRHAGEQLAVGLDLVPPRRPAARRRAVVELLPGRLARGRRPCGLAGAVSRLWRAGVVRYAEERDLCVERVEVADARRPEERARRGPDELPRRGRSVDRDEVHGSGLPAPNLPGRGPAADTTITPAQRALRRSPQRRPERSISRSSLSAACWRSSSRRAGPG